MVALAARTLASTLRSYRRSPDWWRRAMRLPFRGFTGLLRRYLGARMLLACEVAIEYYLGLAASPQLQARPGGGGGVPARA